MIGILDSGSGGLTVLRALREELPSCDIIYFGDIKNAPYGPKNQRELSRLTVSAIERLRDQGVERIVSACNSVSASLAVSLLDASELQTDSVIEMVGPTVSYFRGIEKRIAVCATEATIQSGMYENAFHMIGQDVDSIAIPELAGMIEFGAEQTDIETSIRTTIEPQLGNFDVLILACTHYPLVADIFTKVIGDDAILFDPAHAVAQRAKKLFWPQEVGEGKTHFLITQSSEHFDAYVNKLFPELVFDIKVVE